MTAPSRETDVELVAQAMRNANHPDAWQAAPGVPFGHFARAAVDALAGRLLPEPVETRTEWGVDWHADSPDGIVLVETKLGSQERAERRAQEMLGQYGIRGYTIVRCEHRRFADGSVWIGDWVKVTTQMPGRPAPEGGWPSGGRPAGRHRTCAGCGDHIWPAEHVYPADASGDTSDNAGVQCAVCEVRTRIAEGQS